MPSQSPSPHNREERADTIERRQPSALNTFVRAVLVGIVPQPSLGELQVPVPCEATGAAVCGCPTPSNSRSGDRGTPKTRFGRAEFLSRAGRRRRSEDEPQEE